MKAPICLFTYNRPEETRKTVEALQHNFLAKESELFIFSDGPKKESVAQKVAEVRSFLRTVQGFRAVHLLESEVNRGLANSIISGVSKVISEYGKVIVVEDDLVSTPNFLNFMNESLDYYENHHQIFSISGYTMDLPGLKHWDHDYYLGYRASSWGWGTWKSRWEQVDWQVKDYPDFKRDLFQQMRFMRGGADMPRMLHKQMNGKVDSWAIRWCYSQFLHNQLTVFPSSSKIRCIGFGASATHTRQNRRFETRIDQSGKTIFNFNADISMDKQLVKEFRTKFSLLNRLYDKFF